MGFFQTLSSSPVRDGLSNKISFLDSSDYRVVGVASQVKGLIIGLSLEVWR